MSSDMVPIHDPHNTSLEDLRQRSTSPTPKRLLEAPSGNYPPSRNHSTLEISPGRVRNNASLSWTKRKCAFV